MTKKTLNMTGLELCQGLGFDPENLPELIAKSPFNSDKPLVVNCPDDFPVDATVSQIIEAALNHETEFHVAAQG